jgi:hypothetical protein
VDVPFWDQWSVLGLAEAFHLHVLTFGQLFAQYNEHRLFFPRVLLLAIDSLAHGNVKWDLLALYFLAAVVLVNVYRLARWTLAGGAARLAVTATLASLLIFSPIQYQNWLWGMQVDMLLPMTCLSTALVIVYFRRGGPWLRLLIAAALATAAGYSYLNGMTCWVLLIPAVVQQFTGKPVQLRAIAAWIALAAINLFAYFYHYRFLSTAPQLPGLLAHPELLIISFLSFVGAPLAFGNERAAHYVGAATILLAGIVFLRLVEVRKEPAMLRRSAPWLTLGGYGLATTLIVTLGRATSSTLRLMESRYTSFSIYLFVCLIFLWPIVFEGAHLRPWVGRFLVSTVVLLHIFTARYAIAQMKESRTDRLESKACLAFFNLINDPCQTQRLDWEVDLLRQRVQSLERLGYFHPPLVQSPDLRRIAASSEPSGQTGTFKSLTNAGIGFYRASGWAALPQRAEPADAVVLTYADATGVPVAFALADWMGPGGAWEKWFKLPPAADSIQAWAFDSLTSRAYLLSGAQRASSAPLTNVRFVPHGRGFLEEVEPGDPITVKGWAVLLNSHKPADMVLLTCGAEKEIVTAGQPWAIRPDVVRELGDSRYLKSSWQIPVREHKLPGACELKAWAYDASSNEAGLLPDLGVLRKTPR